MLLTSVLFSAEGRTFPVVNVNNTEQGQVWLVR